MKNPIPSHRIRISVFLAACFLIGLGAFSLFRASRLEAETGDKKLCKRNWNGTYYCSDTKYRGCFIPNNGDSPVCHNKIR